MSEQLSDEELAKIRKIIQMDERREWLYTNIRSVASWLVVVIPALTVMWENLKRAAVAILGQ